jgi:hypothetical protein
MKVKFTEAPHGRHYKVGEVHDFHGPVAETYARKYIARGWAVEHKDEPAPKVGIEGRAGIPGVVGEKIEPAKPTLGLPALKK